MVAADQAKLAAEYCGQGVPVQYQELQGADHSNAGATFIGAGRGVAGRRGSPGRRRRAPARREAIQIDRVARYWPCPV